MPRYRRVAAVNTTASVRDLRSVKEPPAPEPVGEKAEPMTVGDMDVKPVDEVSATAGEQSGEPTATPLEDVGEPPEAQARSPAEEPRMSGIDEALDEAITELNSITVDADITVRNLAKREVDVRLAPFDVAIDTITGPEVIERGAFRGIAPDSVLLMGLEHEVHLGIGQDGKVIPTRRPMGRSYAIEERDDGGYGSFRVAKTSAGDEFLALAEDGVIRGVSVEMGRNVKTRSEMRSGRRTSVVTFTDTRAISPTYHPAYASAQVLAMRAEQEDAPVAADNEAATAAPEASETPKTEAPSGRPRGPVRRGPFAHRRHGPEVRPVIRHRPRPPREDRGAQSDGLPASRRGTVGVRRDSR